MMTIALTGNVGSGKSTVASIWHEAEIPVLSADVVAKEVVQPGTPGLAAVVDSFGSEVLDESGALDRDAMRGVVFDDPDARSRLESILHPLIRARRDEWVEERRVTKSSSKGKRMGSFFIVFYFRNRTQTY